tara:strand:+ start:406 stop:603 length:198 start_codon:yes stop_codon:yes gene_type:complete
MTNRQRQIDMVAKALELGITAPDSRRSGQVEEFSAGLDETEIAMCKMMALENIMGISDNKTVNVV